MALRKDNTTGHIGVTIVSPNGKKPYRASFFHQKEKIVVGTYKTLEEAVSARSAAIIKHALGLGLKP